MSQPHGIPLELCRPIFEQVTSKSTLCSVLALLSHFTQAEAERLLYKELKGGSRVGVTALFQRICNMPRIARYVHSIQIPD
jgi:hypothetical protein